MFPFTYFSDHMSVKGFTWQGRQLYQVLLTRKSSDPLWLFCYGCCPLSCLILWHLYSSCFITSSVFWGLPICIRTCNQLLKSQNQKWVITSVSHWLNEWVGNWANEKVGYWVNERVSCWVNEWVSRWVIERVNHWLNKWISQWVNESVSHWLNEWVCDSVTEWVSKEWASQWGSKKFNRFSGCFLPSQPTEKDK